MSKFASIRNKILGASVMASAGLACAAPADQLDSLNTTLTTISTKAETISGTIIGIVTIAVVMVIVIGWLKKGKQGRG